jgi:hypothetical protein
LPFMSWMGERACLWAFMQTYIYREINIMGGNLWARWIEIYYKCLFFAT